MTTKNWKKSAEAYKYFAKEFINLDFSKKAAEDMYNFETYGKPKFKYYEKLYNGKCNGYAVGKHWMDVTLAMWKEDIQDGLLLKLEILDNEEIPEKVKQYLEGVVSGRHALI